MYMKFLRVTVHFPTANPTALTSNFFIPVSQILSMIQNGSTYTVNVNLECLKSLPPNAGTITYMHTNDSVMSL